MSFGNIIRSFFPEKIINWLRYKPFRPFEKNGFAQEGEDILIDFFLQGKRNGAYIDIGANEPFKGSNTFFFHKERNWTGIVVDPLPGTRAKFEVHRPKDTVIECGVSNEKGSLTFYVLNETMMSTFSKEWAKKRIQENPHHKIEKEVEIPVNTLKDILDEYWPKGKAIDLLSVDTESQDLNVLMGNDWKTYRPSYIVVHDKEMQMTKDGCISSINDYLLEQGYRFRSRCLFSSIYTIEED